jgi:hypothetical protein
LYVALDIDEYLLPLNSSASVLDELVEWMDSQKKNIVFLHKLNFSPVPHFHEPIHLLTPEAFQTRHAVLSSVNMYVSTSPKIAQRIIHPSFTKDTTTAAVYCCTYHGCLFNHETEYNVNRVNCSNEKPKLWSRHRGIKWVPPPNIYHYARSLEKFTLKQKTYDSLSSGNDSLGNPQGLSIFNFLNRAYGSTFDNSGLAWTCRLRRWIADKTGVANFLRAGSFWYRNPEFNRDVTDPRKRGRSGNGKDKRPKKNEISPYPPGSTYQRARPPFQIANAMPPPLSLPQQPRAKGTG